MWREKKELRITVSHTYKIEVVWIDKRAVVEDATKKIS